ncbi:MAG: hypothetical protein ACHWZW_02780 [Spirulina sp.]
MTSRISHCTTRQEAQDIIDALWDRIQATWGDERAHLETVFEEMEADLCERFC